MVESANRVAYFLSLNKAFAVAAQWQSGRRLPQSKSFATSEARAKVASASWSAGSEIAARVSAS